MNSSNTEQMHSVHALFLHAYTSTAISNENRCTASLDVAQHVGSVKHCECCCHVLHGAAERTKVCP